MPFVPVENTALVETRMLYDNQKVENTLWVLNDTAWDGASLVELATEVKSWWDASYAGLVTTGVTLREVVCTDMTTDTGAVGSVSGAGSVGTVGGTKMPSNVSLAVSFRTASRGRSFRGRNYLVGLSNSQIEQPNTAASDYIEAVIAAYNDFMSAIDTAGWTWVVASRFSGVDPDTKQPIPREAGVTTPIVTVVVTDTAIDSQRRRLPGRGQ
jgi:hypothetical protein